MQFLSKKCGGAKLLAKIGMPCLQTKTTNSETGDGLCFSLREVFQQMAKYLKLSGRVKPLFLSEMSTTQQSTTSPCIYCQKRPSPVPQIDH